ncbi:MULTISPECIES: hypothetical protein [Kribbella]|nr:MULTISPECIES: hypothetical protein [Kribbella]
MIRVKPRHPLRLGMAGMLVSAPMFVCLALVPHTLTTAAAAFLVGLGFELFGIGWETALGQHIPLDQISRVASYDMLGSFIASPIGQLAVGYLAAVLSIKAVELYGRHRPPPDSPGNPRRPLRLAPPTPHHQLVLRSSAARSPGRGAELRPPRTSPGSRF